MSTPPARPKIYHITHVDNLRGIVETGCLLSDRTAHQKKESIRTIGMSEIKRRRLEEIEVPCHPGTHVGDYVPFYFCPRSIMLYVLFRANHPDLMYRGGQEPIVHLEADLLSVIDWANRNGISWAFSLSNAGSRYVEFRSDANHLNQLNWRAIESTDFRDRMIHEDKQAEFLICDSFPFDLVSRIGVHSNKIRSIAIPIISSASHQPGIEIIRHWYF